MSTNVTSRLGKMVLYTLSEMDVRDIIQSRRQAGIAAKRGNDPHEGDVYPAIIVADWLDPAYETGEKRMERFGGEGKPNIVLSPAEAADQVSVNLQVFLDGTDVYWATSRSRSRGGDKDSRKGKWFEPVSS